MRQNSLYLIDKIFDNSRNYYGIDYFNQFQKDLSKYSFAEIISCLVSNPQISFEELIEFILSSPSLWSKLSIKEWIDVMYTLNPRPNSFSKEIFDKGYIDIHFLCKYLGINAINIFLKEENNDKEDKKKILQYSKKIALFLFMDEIDIEELDGKYFVDKSILNKLRNKLVRPPNIQLFKVNEYQLKKYLEEELSKIS